MFLLKKRYWLSFALLLTIFLVLRAIPASWVIYGVQQAVPGFQVSGVFGSPWRGGASYGQWLNRGQVFPLGKLEWRLQWVSLLKLNPCISFSTQTTGQTIKGDACYGLLSGTARLNDVDVSLPVAKISPYFNVDLEGDIDIYIKEATWHKDQSLGDTDINALWQRASLYNGNQWIALGDIQAIANNDNGGLVAQLSSVQTAQKYPPVDLDLNANITQLTAAQPSFKVKGTVKLGPSASGLEPMLQFIGEPVGSQGYRIDINE